MDIIRQELNALLEENKVTIPTLAKATSLNEEFILRYLKSLDESLSTDNNSERFLEDIVSCLSWCEKIPDDERIKAVIETLVHIYGMSIENIAKCINVSLQSIICFIENSNEFPVEEKYKIAVRTMYLFYVLKFPDYSKMPETV